MGAMGGIAGGVGGVRTVSEVASMSKWDDMQGKKPFTDSALVGRWRMLGI